MNITVRDDVGYARHRAEVDAITLELAAKPAGASYREILECLVDAGIGDAKSKERLEMGYSTTGAIGRAALYALRSAKFLRMEKRISGRIVEWHSGTGHHREDPGEYFDVATENGLLRLAQMKAEAA